jgi:hypothetical protein
MRQRRLRPRATTLSLHLLLPAALALPAALPRPAAAQVAPPQVSDEAEVPLPDIKAIERGGRTRASVSFGGPMMNEPGQPTGTAPAQPAGDGRGSDSVRRIGGPQTGADTASAGAASGIYGLDGLAAEAGPMRPGQLPEQHVVKKGETLTSVCELYFADPWCWPRLWSENPQVTNPHWIFPGDVLRLRPGNAPATVASRPAPGGGMRLTSNRKGFDSKAVLLREIGFIDKDALADSARITGSREEKIMLATGDQAYLGFAKDRPLRAGERYSVFVADTKNPIRSPENGQVLGYLVRVYGDILVDQIADRNVARGTLLDLAEPVERGYGVSPKVRLFRQIEPRPAAVTLEARVVASFSPTIMLAAENFVVLSRGARDGLTQGNRGFVVRRGDGYRPIMEGWQKPDPRFPKEVVAELWIMDVREGASVAWVARSSKELRVGEFAELRKGH